MRLLALALSVALAGPALAQNSSMDVGPQALDLRYQPGDAAAPRIRGAQATSTRFPGRSDVGRVRECEMDANLKAAR